MADKFATDEDAATYLYGCKPTDDKYRQLKSRFKKRLLNTLFFLDINQPATSNYNRAYFSCNKDWTLVKILLSNQAHSTAAYLAKQILSTALKFKFADIIVNCARILREYYALIEENEKAYEEYDHYCKQFQNVQDAEIRSEELYQRVVINYYKPPSKNTGLKDKIDIYCEALVGLSEIYDSPVVHYNRYMVWAYRYEMLADYHQMYEICEQAEVYIEKNPNYYREDKLAEIAMKRMTALLHIKDYELMLKKGKKTLENLMRNLEKSDVWFDLMEYRLLLCIHVQKYSHAVRVFHEVITDRRFADLSEENQEKWALIEGFLYYIQSFTPDLELEINDGKIRRKKKFRPKKLLTEPLLFPKSMKMYSVIYTILQVLFFLEEQNYEEAIEKVERLKSFSTRQLKKEEDFRTIQFIRLLQQLAKANFDFSRIGVYKKYLERLDEVPFRYRGLINELEIIRYEDLWALILQRINVKISDAVES